MLFAKDRKFEAVECESCKWTVKTQNFECKTFTPSGGGLQHITVFENKFTMFSKAVDGTTSAGEYPQADDKCVFNANGKFSFNCTSVSSHQIQMFQSSQEFNGKDSYKSTWKWYITVAGEPRLAEDSKLTCKMKG